MDENDEAREPEEQAAQTRRLWESSYGRRRGDWPDPLREPCEPTQDELDLLHSQVPGHRWDGWRRLTEDADYFAACSCGWRSTETGDVSPMLRQVQDHLDAVRAVRGRGRAPQTAQAPRRAGQERDASQHELQLERTRELHAAVESQQWRLSQALEHSTDLLSVSEEQADRLVAALQHAAAGAAPEWAKTEASAQRAQVLQRRAEHAREVRNHIVAAAGALAAIAEEIAMLDQHRETRRSSEYYLGLAPRGWLALAGERGPGPAHSTRAREQIIEFGDEFFQVNRMLPGLLGAGAGAEAMEDCDGPLLHLSCAFPLEGFCLCRLH